MRLASTHLGCELLLVGVLTPALALAGECPTQAAVGGEGAQTAASNSDEPRAATAPAPTARREATVSADPAPAPATRARWHRYLPGMFK